MSRSKLAYKQADQLIAEHSDEVSSPKLVDEPLVSVCFQAYNHAEFIEQALDSVLMQEANFPFEIIIGDDASTDGTSEIADRYQHQHPDKIKILRSTKNLGKYTGNGRLNFLRNLRACRGKYIAILEGDDYWTDPEKLQKQVDFLEEHEACFMLTHILPAAMENSKPGWYDLDRLFNVTYLPHASNFIIRKFNINKYNEALINMLGGEMCLLYIAATEGKIYHADYQVSEYRIHAGGVHNSQSKIKQQEGLIQHLKIIKKYFNVSWLEYHKKRSYMMSDLSKVTGKYTKTLAAYRLFFLVCESLPAFFVKAKRFFSPRRIIGIMMPSAVKREANLFFGDFDKGGFLFKRIAVFYQVKVRKRRLALMSILSLSEHKKLAELEPSSNYESIGPKTIKAVPVKMISKMPPLGLHQFNDVVVNAKSNCIASGNNLYCESFNSNEQFNQGLVEWHDGDDAIIKTLPEDRLEDGFFLAGLGSFNWYHWLVEILPKVMCFNVVPTKNILVSDFVASCPSMLGSLKSIIGDEYKLIFMKSYKNYRVKNLYHINAVSYVPFELKAENQFKVEDVFMRGGLLMDMKEKIMAVSKGHLETSTKKRIFIERTHHRVPSNQAELASALATLGFEGVSVETLTLNEQIDLFHNAECIVGASGAAFTNMMFAGENLKVICFMPRSLRDFSCFSNLAKIFSVDLTYSFYDLDESEHHYSNEFEIDITEALNTVNTVLAH